MIDVRRLRTDLDGARAALARRGIDTSELDHAAKLDERVREVGARRDDLRSRINAMSKEVGAAFKAGDRDGGAAKQAESRALGEEEKRLAEEAAAVEAELRDVLLVIPNLPDEAAPDGDSEDDNRLVRVVGLDADRDADLIAAPTATVTGVTSRSFAEHQRVPHWEVGAALGILDLERGAKMSGSMFPLYRGAGATIVRALCQLALDRNSDAYEELRPPSLVRTETMVSTGHLPKFADDAYSIGRDELWAIPTAEVPLTSLARDELLDEADLPVKLMAYSPCYRREAGSAGRDTRGVLRVHEFDKVELLVYATPEQATDGLFDILARAEANLSELGLPYRVQEICTGDLGLAHARSFDLEVYAPGCDMWLEVSSVSWYSDYQSRRAQLRYRKADGSGTALIHTVNGSAVAVPRVWAALVENNRQPDGSVTVPEALRPYCRGLEVIVPPR